MRKNWIVTSLATAALACGAVASGLFWAGDLDLTSVPPKASEVFKAIEANELTLADAIAKATGSVEGGRALSAKSVMGSDGNSVSAYEVAVYTENEARTVMVNAGDGEVTDSTIIPRFPGEAFEGEIVETASGLQYVDIVVGDGEQPANSSAKVEVHYTGWLVDGTKFDSSVDRGQSISFGLNQVIAGWTEGVGSMKIGGKRKLIIPGHLGYGPRGSGPIPGNAVLVFDVELLGIEQ